MFPATRILQIPVKANFPTSSLHPPTALPMLPVYREHFPGFQVLLPGLKLLFPGAKVLFPGKICHSRYKCMRKLAN